MLSNKLSIRPTLELSSKNPNEDFQNKTLRPILKLQNSILLSVFLQQHPKFEIGNVNENLIFEKVQNALRKNVALKNKMIGMVIGLCTDEELEIYQQNESEYNKRIIGMLTQRLADNINEK